MAEMRPLMHYHLVEAGLFQDNTDSYVLPLFPPDQCFPKIYNMISNINLDSLKGRTLIWAMNAMSFVIRYGIVNKDSEKTYNYEKFVEKLCKVCLDPSNHTEANLSQEESQKMIIDSLLYLSMVCEPSSTQSTRSYFEELIKDLISKELNAFDKEIKSTIFKIVLGICDSMITDPKSYEFSDGEHELFIQFLFHILNLTTQSCPENWQIFNEFVLKWPENPIFRARWSQNFLFCLILLTKNYWYDYDIPNLPAPETIGIKLEYATDIFIRLIESANVLSTSRNFHIVHDGFGCIIDCINRSKENLIGLFSKKWFIDEIFEIFSKWPLAEGPCNTPLNNDLRTDSICSFVTLLENGIIQQQTNWFQNTISYFKRELISPESSLAPVLLPRLPSLIAAHPYLTRELISPIVKCLLRQVDEKSRNNSINIRDPKIENLILSIAEIYLQNTMTIGTINNIKKLQKRMYNQKVDMKNKDSGIWQNQMLILMISGCYKAFSTYVLRLLDENNDLPAEFFIFFAFVPYLMPTFFKHGIEKKGVEFELEFVRKKNLYMIIKDPKSFHAFAMSMQAIYLEGSRFKPLSPEKVEFNANLKAKDHSDLVNFLEMCGHPNAKYMDVETAKNLYLENSANSSHFLIWTKANKKVSSVSTSIDTSKQYENYSILTIIDSPKFGNIMATIRSKYGVITVEIADNNLIDRSTPQAPEIDTKPQTVGFEVSSSVDGTFNDPELSSKFASLASVNIPMQFKAYDDKVKGNLRVYSCLTSLGLISSDSLSKTIPDDLADDYIKKYDNISPFETIEVAVLCYTKDYMGGVGSVNGTSEFIKFIDALGEKQYYHSEYCGNVLARVFTYCSVRVVYIARCCMEEPNQESIAKIPIVLAFNETGFTPMDKSFVEQIPSSLIFSVKSIVEDGGPTDGLFSVILLAQPRGIVLPFIQRIPRLVSKRNLQAMIALIPFVYYFATVPHNPTWEARGAILDDVKNKIKDDTSLNIQFCVFKNNN